MQQTETLGPEWLAHRYDEAADKVRFVQYNRVERSGVPFLIDQYLPARPFRALSRDEARRAATAAAPIHFVFHSGFCCSTLLAACFDQPGLAGGFSEPMILNDAVGWRSRGAPPAAVGKLLDDSLGFLARPFDGDSAAIVKPSTLINGLGPAMLRLRPDARAILIHAPLADFLASIARKGLDGRLWARQLFLAMRREKLTDRLGFDDEAFFGQTDLQIAACCWLGQQALFGDLVKGLGDRVATTSSDRFLERPEATLRAGAELFGLDITDSQVEHALTVTMRRNSKDMRAFGAAERQSDYASAHGAHGDEIAKVAVWAEAVAEAAGIAMELQRGLA